MTKQTVTELSYQVVGCAIKVHKELGPGLLESVYEKCLKYELRKNGFHVEQQVFAPIIYDGVEVASNLVVDLLVENIIIVELKTVEHILPVHQAQLMTYMKLLKKPQGLLINFYTDNITKSLIPVVNDFFKDLPDV